MFVQPESVLGLVQLLLFENIQALVLKLSKLNRELLLELGQKKKIYYLWKEGLASQGEDRAAAHTCREKTRKAKARFELTMATVGLDNKKNTFSSMSTPKRGLRKTLD